MTQIKINDPLAMNDLIPSIAHAARLNKHVVSMNNETKPYPHIIRWIDEDPEDPTKIAINLMSELEFFRYEGQERVIYRVIYRKRKEISKEEQETMTVDQILNYVTRQFDIECVRGLQKENIEQIKKHNETAKYPIALKEIQRMDLNSLETK